MRLAAGQFSLQPYEFHVHCAQDLIIRLVYSACIREREITFYKRKKCDASGPLRSVVSGSSGWSFLGFVLSLPCAAALCNLYPVILRISSKHPLRCRCLLHLCAHCPIRSRRSSTQGAHHGLWSWKCHSFLFYCFRYQALRMAIPVPISLSMRRYHQLRESTSHTISFSRAQPFRPLQRSAMLSQAHQDGCKWTAQAGPSLVLQAHRMRVPS